MNRFYILLVTAISLLIVQNVALAHGTDRDEGRRIVEALKSGIGECGVLDDVQFENVGDYYMEQMMGESHEQMDAMMEQMMGEEGLMQMHVAMGKRMSGCDASAQMPGAMISGMGGMISMMGGGRMMDGNMMGGAGMMNAQNTGNIWSAILRSAYPSGFITLWYVVGILGAVTLVFAIVKYLRELFK